MYWSSVCVGKGRDKEPGQAEMGLTILLIGFRLGRRWVGALAPIWGPTLRKYSLFKGSPVSVFLVPWVSAGLTRSRWASQCLAPLEVAGFGGSERGGY